VKTSCISPPCFFGHLTRRHVPAGFTLVELLVVIAIIGMVMAIATPTVFSAVKSARNAAVKSEIDLLHMALMNYKNEYGSFPPADMQGLWLASGTVNVRHPVYKHLVRVFPRINEVKGGDASPYKDVAQLSPAQSLVFWLNGFHQNPEYPLTNNGSPGTRRKLFDFEQSRLYAASAYVVVSGTPSAQQFKSRSDPAASAFERDYPVYFTPHAKAGLPYVYFDNRCYDTAPAAGRAGDVSYTALSANSVDSTAYPYFSSSPPNNPTWSQLHMVPDTFQLIAPGADGSYGSSPAAFPLAFKVPSSFGSLPGNESGALPSAADTLKAAGQADNLTNFADKPLRDAAESLKAK
jgi:prepilin-type N-terminal cleavage/methylation domain-containing protein